MCYISEGEKRLQFGTTTKTRTRKSFVKTYEKRDWEDIIVLSAKRTERMYQYDPERARQAIINEWAWGKVGTW